MLIYLNNNTLNFNNINKLYFLKTLFIYLSCIYIDSAIHAFAVCRGLNLEEFPVLLDWENRDDW